VRVVLNGEPRDLPERATVADAIDASGAPSRTGIAVAVDGEVVPRGAWATERLSDGQSVEVLQAVQGG
jgi:sulfur carrier protein